MVRFGNASAPARARAPSLKTQPKTNADTSYARVVLRLAPCLLAVGILGCGQTAGPTEAVSVRQQSVEWYPIEVGDDSRSIRIAAYYGPCDGTEASAAVERENAAAVRIAVTIPAPTGAVRCGALRIREFDLALAAPLNGRRIAGKGMTDGAFGNALETPARDRGRIPNVVGARSDQARQILCRWGMRPPSKFVATRNTQVTSQAPKAGSPLRPPGREAQEFIGSSNRACSRPVPVGSVVRLQSSRP